MTWLMSTTRTFQLGGSQDLKCYVTWWQVPQERLLTALFKPPLC